MRSPHRNRRKVSMTDWDAVQEGAMHELLAAQVADGYFDDEDGDADE